MKLRTKLIYFLVIIFNVFLWQNCTPSFVSNTSSLNNFGSNIPGGPTDNEVIQPDPRQTPEQSPFAKSIFIDNSKFGKYINSSNEFQFKCDDQNLDIGEFTAGKLTREELKNTMRNVLGVGNLDTGLYPQQSKVNKYRSANKLLVEETLISSMELVADAVTNQFVRSLESGENNLWDCNFSNACYRSLVNDLPKYLWRKAINSQERIIINSVADVNSANSADERKYSIQKLLKFLIMSPQFYIKKPLVRNAPASFKLNSYQLVSRLSFFLTSSAPSKELIDLAAEKQVLSKNDIQKIAREMLTNRQNRKSFVNSFFSSYLEFQDAYESNAQFNRKSIKEIADTFLDRMDNVLQNNLPVSSIIKNKSNSLLTSQLFAYQTFHDKNDSAPILRGAYVTGNILCRDTPDLSPATEAQIEAVQADMPKGLNNLEIMEYHRKKAVCASCHNIMDPPSIGLETVDAFGNIRTHYDNGDVIEDKFNLGQHAFNGLDQYLNIVAESVDFKACFSNHIYSGYIFSEKLKYRSCFTTELFGQNSEVGFMDLIVNAVTSNSFTSGRKPSSNE